MRVRVFTSLLLPLLPAAAEPVESRPPAELSLNVRVRHEQVNQAGAREARAFTWRTRLGLATGDRRGWRAGLEFEHLGSPAGDDYNQAGLNPAAAGRASVSDPEGAELNQAWVRWEARDTKVQLGRQRWVLDDGRFVGDVGWRQNMQTFDGVTLLHSPAKQLAVHYGYFSRINRVLGPKHPQGRWRADTHVLHVSRSGLPGGARVFGHASLLDFPDAAVQSCATLALGGEGESALGAGAQFGWRAAVALQADHGSSPLDYQAAYAGLELALRGRNLELAAGAEQLGSDRGQGFRTPLATLHAFNGWADLFVNTPGGGLRDCYVKLASRLPGGVSFVAKHHRFDAARGGERFGAETDVQLTRRLGRRVTALAKIADFRSVHPAFPDVRKFWLQLEYAR